jgi:predicted ester cyclase
MTAARLANIYRDYIACLNDQDWETLGTFVRDDVVYNGSRTGLRGYREMLERDFRAIPDLRFNIEFMTVETPRVASRLQFDCTPTGTLFDMQVNGRTVQFAEHVFYTFLDDRIAEVWSIIDKAAIASQLSRCIE